MSKQLSILYALKMSLSHLADHIMFGDSKMFRLESEGKFLLVTKLQWFNYSGACLYLCSRKKKYSKLQERASTVEVNFHKNPNIFAVFCLLIL